MTSDPAPCFVACLCAGWCRTCDDYRATFEALAAEFAASARFLWVDIEDAEDDLGGIEVVDFPTLLIARGSTAAFFGPVTPQPPVGRRVVGRAVAGALGSCGDPALDALAARLRARPPL